MSSIPEQHWNPQQYAKNGRFVSDLAMPVVELLAPKPGERILDLGCGDGVLSQQLLSLGCNVVGVDSSPEMVAAAQALGVAAQVMDGQALQFNEEFDAVFSNAALHWMKKPVEVIAGVWNALKPGGRFVGEFGGHGNIASITAATESALSLRGVAVITPWFFPRPEHYRQLLEARGFIVAKLILLSRPTALPGDVSGWLETFAKPFISALSLAERAGFLAELVEALRPVLVDAEGHWLADYVRLRFSALKPLDAN
jgi:trans-aconitate methyltransferase